MPIIKIIVCCLIGYLLGNFSPAYLFGRLKGYDIRKEGSGNVGATNAFLLVGRHAFVITAALDILKAFAAWKICELLFPALRLAGPLGGAACVIGHMYPALLGFHGGKGLASLGGVALAWHWQWFFILLGAAIVIAFATRYVCLVAPVMSVVIPGCYFWPVLPFCLCPLSRSSSNTARTSCASWRGPRCGRISSGTRRVSSNASESGTKRQKINSKDAADRYLRVINGNCSDIGRIRKCSLTGKRNCGGREARCAVWPSGSWPSDCGVY